jgi:uncharacterized protein YjbJ (UPF0337 family)
LRVRRIPVATKDGAVEGRTKNEKRTGVKMGKIDEAKGRVKEAAGAVTGNDQLKGEGKADKAAGKVKDAVDTVKKKVTK